MMMMMIMMMLSGSIGLHRSTLISSALLMVQRCRLAEGAAATVEKAVARNPVRLCSAAAVLV
jgi:hypothetical protein